MRLEQNKNLKDVLNSISKNSAINIETFIFRYSSDTIKDYEINQIYLKELQKYETEFKNIFFEDKLSLIFKIGNFHDLNNFLIPEFLETFIKELFFIDLDKQKILSEKILIHELYNSNSDYLINVLNKYNIDITKTTFFNTFNFFNHKSTFLRNILLNFDDLKNIDFIANHLTLDLKNDGDVKAYDYFNSNLNNNAVVVKNAYSLLKKINLMNDDFLTNSYVKYNYIFFDNKEYMNDINKLSEEQKIFIDLTSLQKQQFHKHLENYLSNAYKNIKSIENKTINFNIEDYLNFVASIHSFNFLKNVFISDKFKKFDYKNILKEFENIKPFDFTDNLEKTYFGKKYPEILEKFILGYKLFFNNQKQLINKKINIKI